MFTIILNFISDQIRPDSQQGLKRTLIDENLGDVKEKHERNVKSHRTTRGETGENPVLVVSFPKSGKHVQQSKHRGMDL